ncbi:CDP-alcohol phosphatidyltransferase family protein [Pontixanthobacter aquaemixtae]|uniref:CDP-alcohol phosphatidyltransferase n=1 Tax=Pontixanthobacter aquaemixtae TaxID=1958940 RepID=A0A844ZVT3_9SPHN|nr:CDP-alcohol phosphatidyltransferase family protein [Pontixanthobacter aquaemixtae]MXO90867.1 hypothetical protein [Pontixanthobacter aquaemixtae]
MPASSPIPILFESEAAANSLVAGIPAAARAARHASSLKDRAEESASIHIGVRGGWVPSALCEREVERLTAGLQWKAVDAAASDNAEWIPGVDLQCETEGNCLEPSKHPGSSGADDIANLKIQARRIISSTGKPGDGVISRHINRPISQTISRSLLHWPGIRPWHATMAAAIIGLGMFAALVFGGSAGLIVGAILFQTASIVDGADGEIARATFRTSARGAMMDSVTDAATNLGFVGGVSFNLYMAGQQHAGIAGAIGFALLTFGSALLAIQSRRDGGPFTFDALKTRFREKPSPLKQWLTYITMRDFYAFAAFLAILAGGATYLLFAFATIASGWFVVLCWTLAQTNTASAPPD